MTTTSPAGLAAGRWIVDVAHSAATFRVRSLGRTVTGTVPIIEGTVDIGPDGLPSAITGSVDLGAIDTGNARRDSDLRKPRLLDLDHHPTMTLAAGTATVSPTGWSVTGRLSARGTSVRLAGDVELSGQARSATLTGHIRLDRCTLGIQAPRIMIGREIDITVTAAIHQITGQ
jgi:polyisoprenoid-binding protein YceI